ncbi:major intrinsic protein [Ditylenchus destructor]|nr:major intrinsic protein [Ditylenchus destructor]
MLQRLFPKNAFRIPSFSSDVNEPPLLFKIADQFGIDRNLVACTLCEFFCTFFLLYGGTSVCAVRKVDGQDFEYQVPVGWGLWLIFTLYLGFNISGSHLNPAISFLMYVLGKISFRRFLCYAAAQFSGAFVGAALTFLVYYEAINDFDGGIRQVYGPNRTANIFSTYPKDYLSTAGGVIDQVVTTAILATMVLSITDEKNNIPKPAQPFLLGISLWTVVSFWAQNCGAALNPARDFAPRVFTFVAGYGWEVFSYRNYTWFWIPIICPMVGGVLAGIVYKTFIDLRWNPSSKV